MKPVCRASFSLNPNGDKLLNTLNFIIYIILLFIYLFTYIYYINYLELGSYHMLLEPKAFFLFFFFFFFFSFLLVRFCKYGKDTQKDL